MSQLLKLQTRLLARGISGALAPTLPSELLAKATIRYCQATEIYLKQLDHYRGPLDSDEMRQGLNNAMDVALTADLIMAACVAQQEKEASAEAAQLPMAENVVPFNEIAPEFPKP